MGFRPQDEYKKFQCTNKTLIKSVICVTDTNLKNDQKRAKFVFYIVQNLCLFSFATRSHLLKNNLKKAFYGEKNTKVNDS